MSDEHRSVDEPHDRLTRLCDAMIDALRAQPEVSDADRCVIFLTDGDRGGAVLNGYDDDFVAMIDVFMHMRSVFRANGKDLQLHTLGQG